MYIYCMISVIDDENPTVYTAGAIVTVTVSLTRKDMRHLFGDDSVNEQTIIDDNKAVGEATEEIIEEQNQSTKAAKPAWLKQKKGQKKSHKKGANKKPTPAKNTQAQSNQVVVNNTQQSDTPNARKKEDKIEKESSKDKLSDFTDSEVESEKSDDEDNREKKDVSLDDDDTEWEK